MAASSATRRGKGRGYGGPAKGAGSDAPSFVESQENRISGDVSADPKVQFRAMLKALDRADQAEALNELVLNIAVNGERDNDRLAAIFGFQNRILGTPVARTVNLNGDLGHLSDDELAERRAWLEAELGGTRSGVGGRTPPKVSS
jgi:hypothetical protein